MAWKHDAQALTELKLYLGAWTTGVISTPAKGAAYQVMLEIELGATPAEAHLVGQTSGASRQVLRDQLQAERLEHIYAVELLAATDPAAGYAYDLSVGRSTHTAAARWARHPFTRPTETRPCRVSDGYVTVRGDVMHVRGT